MPLGTNHRINGLLLSKRGQLVLQVDGGGVWRLEDDPGLSKYLGKRVCIEGIRSGFDLLTINRIDAA